MIKEFANYSENVVLSADQSSAGRRKKKSNDIPIWYKTLLTLEEAAVYSGLGIQKLRDLSNGEDCKFVVWNGSKRMLKRKLLDEYLEGAFSI